MRKTITKLSIYASALMLAATTANAQMSDTTTEFKPGGTLWGYTFGDFAYKGNADDLNRGGGNQYTGMPANANTFQFRRIYLGYNYNISAKFSSEFLLAAEDDFNGTSITQANNASPSTGDVTAGGKFAPYVKIANIRWKNIFKNSDLVIGQQFTPSFAKTGRDDQTAEEVWGYRCVERTVSDIRRTPSFDLGASLQGWFDKDGKFGYMAMVGNGTGGAKPATNSLRSFYGCLYGKFFNKRLIVNLYADYTRLDWGLYVPGALPGTASPNGAQYTSREMTKLFVAWNTKKLTIGFEGFQNVFLGGLKVTETDKNTYYRTFSAIDISTYVRGRIISAPNGDPRLNWFVRYDNYNPSNGLSTVASAATTTAITTATGVSNYDPFTKEQFFTAGIDYMPFKNVHFIPNVWMNTYQSSLDPTGENDAAKPLPYTKYSSEVNGSKGTDMVYRLTFYYIFNPKQGTTKY